MPEDRSRPRRRAWFNVTARHLALRRLALAMAAAAFGAALQAPARAQTEASVELSGTLQKARTASTLVLGYRLSSIPFSYVSERGQPIGYSIDLCRAVVDAASEALGRSIAIRWQPVTAESRIEAVRSGAVDLECGSTTSNVERQKVVAFSPTMFVAGTKLLVRKGSAITSFRDLGGKRVVVTAGTTNAAVMADLARKFKLDLTLLTAADHAASFELLGREASAGGADAFALDDVLLSGLLAQKNAPLDYAVVGEFLSYEPYGLMFRRDDAAFATLVSDTFRQLSEDGELERLYDRWFLRRLPSGVSLDLPMSPQIETMFRALDRRPE